MAEVVTNENTSPKSTPFNERILTPILLAPAITSFIFFVVHVFLQTHGGPLIMSLVSGLVYGGLFLYSKKENSFNSTLLIFSIFSVIIICVSWFFTGGVIGGSGYFFILAIAFILILSPLKYRFITTILFLCLLAFLFVLEINNPNIIVHEFNSDLLKYFLMVNIFFTILLIAWIITNTKHEYEKEQNKTKEQNRVLINAQNTKSRFLANISHEIRTPMNGVMGMASLLEQTNLDDEQKEYVETIIASSDRLLRIINQILDYSKADVQKIDLNEQAFVTQQCVKEAIQINTPNALKKNLDLTYEIDSNVPRNLRGDSEKLQQILINLIGNAIKFTNKGSIHLLVEKLAIEEDYTKLLFTIKDTGIGISKENIPYLFDAFTQVDDSRTKQHSGTGLGLAISKYLVELMGGEIWVESEQNKGTTFFFTIKIKALQRKSKLVKEISPNFVDTACINPELKVLIVEDDKVNQLLAIRLFEKLGIAPDAVLNGAGAIEALRKQKYSIVFMDIQMPVMDGVEATIFIRENLDYQPIIIAMTANSMPEDRLQYEKAGMDDFVAKPVKLKNLDHVLQKWQRDL